MVDLLGFFCIIYDIFFEVLTCFNQHKSAHLIDKCCLMMCFGNHTLYLGWSSTAITVWGLQGYNCEHLFLCILVDLPSRFKTINDGFELGTSGITRITSGKSIDSPLIIH